MQKPTIMLHSSIRLAAALGLFTVTACASKSDDDSGSNAGSAGMSMTGSGGTGGTPGSGGMPGSGGTSAGGSAGTGSPAGGSAGTGVVGGAGMGTGGMATSACNSGMMLASPDTNYQFQSTLTINLTSVKPSSEIHFDWSGVTTDFLKKPVDLNTLGQVEIALWSMNIDQFEKNLNDDTLSNPVIIAWINPTAGKPNGTIFELNVPDGPVDMATTLGYLDVNNYPPDKYMYSVMVADGHELGQGTRMLAGFKLDPASTNTDVKIDSNSTKVDFTATINSRPPTYIPAGTAAGLGLDWSKMRVTASGGDFSPSSITRIRIGSYEAGMDLEHDNFLKLDEIATEMYSYDIPMGTKATYDQLKTKDGKVFAGIDATHQWIVALNCTSCQNPAPWYLSVLKPCPAM